MSWRSNIEAQIGRVRQEALSCYGHGIIDAGVFEDAAGTMQALLDVAEAAGLLTDSLRVVEEHDDRNLSNATKLARQNDALMRLRVALDKLREVGDE